MARYPPPEKVSIAGSSAAQGILVPVSVSQPAGRRWQNGWLSCLIFNLQLVFSPIQPVLFPLPSALWGIPGLHHGKAARVAARPALGHPSHATCNQKKTWPSEDRQADEATCASLFHASSWHTRGASMSHCQDPHPAILGRCGGREWCGRWAMIERPPLHLLPTSSSPSSHSPKRPRAWGKGIPRTKLPTSLSHLDLPRMYTCYFVTLNLSIPTTPFPFRPRRPSLSSTSLPSPSSRLPPRRQQTTTYPR